MLEQFLPIAPLMLVLLGAIISVGLEAAVPRLIRPTVQIVWTLLVLLSALGWTIIDWHSAITGKAAMGALSLDGPTWLTWTLLLIFCVISVLLFAERKANDGQSPFAASVAAVPGSVAEREAIAAHQEHSEVFALLLFSLSGMMMFVSANGLLTMFVALEIFSFPLYVLCAMARRRRLISQEAALKYFLLGGLSSALFLYGTAMLYGYAGSFRFAEIDQAVLTATQSGYLLLAGVLLVMCGVLFKIGAAPFHSWVPDVYTGAPTPVTGFMAVCTKIAAAVGMLRVLYVALGSVRWDWQLAIAVVAILTMAVGALIGLKQNDVKRVMAYSSIAHAGFVLVGVIGAMTTFSGLAAGQVGSVESVLFYLLAYGFATLPAFALITLVKKEGFEATSYENWRGMGRKNPIYGLMMTVFLLSMAGIPLTGGFVGKLLAFISGWQGGYWWLVLLAVAFSLVTAGFYFRILWLIWQPVEDSQVRLVKCSPLTQIVLWLGMIATILLGIFPGSIISLLVQSALFIR